MTVVSNNPSMLGVAGILGIHREQVDSRLDRFRRILPSIEASNVFLHVEETDEISHRLDPQGKIDLLKQVDDVLSQNMDHLLGNKVAFVIDHGTSSISGQHIRMKVPFAVSEVIEPLNPTISSARTLETMSRSVNFSIIFLITEHILPRAETRTNIISFKDVVGYIIQFFS